MSVMPELSSAAVNDPHGYIDTLKEIYSELKAGSAHVRTQFGGEYLNFRSDDIAELRTGINRLHSLIANGQLDPRLPNIDDPMPWLRSR
jgi:hypothetical protein